MSLGATIVADRQGSQGWNRSRRRDRQLEAHSQIGVECGHCSATPDFPRS